MKKIVRLTESDLTRIVKRVLKETEEGSQKEGKCMNTKKTSQTVGNGSVAKLIYDLSIVKPQTLQNKIKNAHSNTGFLDGKTMYAERFWDWNDIKGSISSAMMGERLGDFQPGPKFIKIYESLQSTSVEWKYENGKVTFYFYETEGC
jgi:hypothetical protein